MIDLIGDEKAIISANRYRDSIMRNIPLVLGSPHFPELTQEEKNRVIDKLVWLANHEHRTQFYLNLGTLSELKPGTAENPTQLTPTILVWAGKKKVPQYKEPKKKIPAGKNGRIIRDAKGL